MAKDNIQAPEDEINEDEIFDEILPEDEPGAEEPAAGAASGEDEPWFVPGKYKTADDAKKGIKTQERYTKRLETSLKNEKKKTASSNQDPGQGPAAPAAAPGTTDTDFLSNPVETTKKIAEEAARNAVAGTASASMQTGIDLLKYKASQMYPDFDIDANERKLAAYVMKYSPEHRARNGLAVLSEAIEKFGGKKRTSPIHSEPGSGPSTPGKSGKKSAADVIKQGIIDAKGYEDPLRNMHAK